MNKRGIVIARSHPSYGYGQTVDILSTNKNNFVIQADGYSTTSEICQRDVMEVHPEYEVEKLSFA